MSDSTRRQNILVTGGAGYIGIHTVVALARAGFVPHVLDNFSNSSRSNLVRAQEIIGSVIPVHEVDVRSQKQLQAVLSSTNFDAVVHLAGLKVISDSQARPTEYFDVNVSGSISLLRAMELHHVKRFVFSSSASVYGTENTMPVAETGVLSPQHPYGQTKCVVEQLLASLAHADRTWAIAALRYFNPVGAHESALIGETTQSRPTNLMPAVVRAALRSGEPVEIFGNDFPTPDGSGVRDFIHVMDLAEGHVAALRYLCRPGVEPYSVVNLGTGRGTSVLQLLGVMGEVAGHPIAHVIRDRRSGDVAESYADVTLAEALLEWRATRTVDDMCESALRWGKRSAQALDG